MKYDVVIVGAGAAGLIAARNLARAGKTVALLEARDRIGGRLAWIDDPRATVPIELGGEFVHGRPAVTYGLLAEIGTTVIDNAADSFTFENGALTANTQDPFETVSEFLTSALERGDDESVEALIARSEQSPAQRTTGVWARRIVCGFDAADPVRASARAIASEWASDASADGAQSRPLGGYAPLIAHLGRSLDPSRVDLRLNTVVFRIMRAAASGVRVDAWTNEREIRIEAARAIITVPHGVLAALPQAPGALTFEPALPPSTQNAIDHIAMGPVIKVVMCFRTAFWETLAAGTWRDGAFFTGDDEFPTLWTQLPVRGKTIVAWAGGPAAEPLGGLSATELIERALASVGRYFGNSAAARDAFECGYVHDWQNDPFSRGAYSYVLVGGEDARNILCEPVDDRLWFAGEATARDGEGGTVAGALESGVRAARDIAGRGDV